MIESGDYISREETLKRLCKDVCNVSDCQCDEIRCEEWFVIHSIPVADVRPVVRGKWKLYSDPGEPWCYVCNICGEKTKDTVMGNPRANFCPNCGADMREES